MGILRGNKHHVAYRLMSRIPDRVFAVSEEVRQHCVVVDRIKPSLVETVYNGIDIAEWNTVPKSAKVPGAFVVATVGNIRRVKGHDVFIRAAASIVPQFPNVSFSIAGDILEPDYFAELQSLVRDLGLADGRHNP